MEMKRNFVILFVFMELEITLLLSLLITCVYSRALGSHRNGWRPGHKKHRYNADMAWEPTARKRDHPNRVDECCPSVTEIIQPLGGVSKSGRILELYRDPNSTQSFYQTSCKEGVKGHPCRYMNRSTRSMCVQRYTYTYALVREFNSNEPWRLDYIRVRSGCSCEVKTFYGRRKKNIA
ncbi:spaetzle domain-containing protein [Trichonephila inaurata madagascariensis]|uniref:Spaetzle domain-containing protein n=1 Tax=Trichonephila inaurata madagascariensis TaxID=2747483 RepID=A0A8X6IEA4_9ARAC|nr:spaetzle domain-containing protein [Trichonephila inaurata madagascariensis]